jgi:hypothetical protein
MYPPDLTQLQTQWSGDAGFPPQSSEASSQHASAVEQVSLAASHRITHDAQSASTISDIILFNRFTFDEYDRAGTDRQPYLSLDKARA